MIIDTNIVIELFKGNKKLADLLSTNSTNIYISSVTIAELYFGAFNKVELAQLNKFISFFTTIHINESISLQTIELMKIYCLSHKLQLPDALIAATALHYNLNFLTLNKKDFIFIPKLKLIKL